MLKVHAQLPSFAALSNEVVSLHPLAPQYRHPLEVAAKDPSIWKHTQHDGSERFNEWWNHTVTAERQFVYVVLGPTGNVVGSTRYYDIEWDEWRLQMGYTWYARAVWGTGLNRACKLLLLAHAFALGFCRVGFSIDADNARSRRAVEKLGAVHDGTLRSHKLRRDGSRRDTAVYSILAHEWRDRVRSSVIE